jgi:ATP-dependent exoDNAse (exonuclease V) beta subunit
MDWRSGGHPVEPEQMETLGEEGQEYAESHGVRWVYPALASSTEEPLDGFAKVAAPSLTQVQEDARLIDALRDEAESHQQRPLGGAVSAESHRLAAEARDEQDPEAAPVPSRTSGKKTGAAVGTAVHGALEHIELGLDPREALAHCRERMAASLRALVEPDEQAAALADAEQVLASFWTGDLGARLRRLEPHIVARELDFIGPPSLVEEARSIEFVTGAIDLVYLDPTDGAFVVADFKTDSVFSAVDIEQRANSYRSQLLAYAAAIQRAFDLAYCPRAELWFLRADELVVA